MIPSKNSKQTSKKTVSGPRCFACHPRGEDKKTLKSKSKKKKTQPPLQLQQQQQQQQQEQPAKRLHSPDHQKIDSDENTTTITPPEEYDHTSLFSKADKAISLLHATSSYAPPSVNYQNYDIPQHTHYKTQPTNRYEDDPKTETTTNYRKLYLQLKQDYLQVLESRKKYVSTVENLETKCDKLKKRYERIKNSYLEARYKVQELVDVINSMETQTNSHQHGYTKFSPKENVDLKQTIENSRIAVEEANKQCTDMKQRLASCEEENHVQKKLNEELKSILLNWQNNSNNKDMVNKKAASKKFKNNRVGHILKEKLRKKNKPIEEQQKNPEKEHIEHQESGIDNASISVADSGPQSPVNHIQPSSPHYNIINRERNPEKTVNNIPNPQSDIQEPRDTEQNREVHLEAGHDGKHFEKDPNNYEYIQPSNRKVVRSLSDEFQELTQGVARLRETMNS